MITAETRSSASEVEDDPAFIAQLRAGDDRAFEWLVTTAGGRMLAVARRMLAREEDAQDAVQEAFLSAFRSLDQFDGRSKLTTWLHRIVVNACLMKRRSLRRRPELQIEEFLPEFLPDGHHANPPRPWDESPDRLESEEVMSMVRKAIDELPEGYREVLILRDIEGIDTEQTGALLGLSAAAVKTRLHRARQALRTILEPRMEEDGG